MPEMDRSAYIFFAIFFGVIGLFLLYAFFDFFNGILYFFDIAPASGTATGYIYYQERSGLWQLDWVCWKDTQFSGCEVFDPAGKNYTPGKYTMAYDCVMFAWAWEHPSECTIVNATRIGNIS